MPLRRVVKAATMRVEKKHSAKGGEEYILEHHAKELDDIYAAIAEVDATKCLRKVSSEKTMLGTLLYSPEALNKSIKSHVHVKGWGEPKATGKREFREPRHTFSGGRFREMDGIKNKVGLEVQFGKYAFMGYDIFAKMVIFKNLGKIDCGIEIVATSKVVSQMSTGVSEFEQIMIDFQYRGEADIDIPVLVLGIDFTPGEVKSGMEKIERFRTNPALMVAEGEVDAPKKGNPPGPK